MALNIQIFSDNRLFPQVFNIVQGTNKVDAVVFTMENYIVGEKDLSTYDWYAHLMGVEGIDAVKLTSAIVDGKLQITFDLTEYVTQLGNTLTYQIVAKDDISSVWNSGKGIILNAESIPADDKIVADYASILRQWELRMEEIAGSLDTAIYYIPYGETLPKEDRIVGRLYYQYLYAENLNGQLEDSNGNILIPEQVAKNIGISAIDGLTASDVQTALEALKTMIENKDSLPAQEGQDGKFLKTVDGKAEWADVEALPEQDGQDGKFLKTVNGKAVWEDAPRGLPLLSSIWSKHILNDASYLRADNFSWHSGDVYKAAYEHLVEDRENAKDETSLYSLELTSPDKVYEDGSAVTIVAYAHKLAVGEKVFDRASGVATIKSITMGSSDFIDSITLEFDTGEIIEFNGWAFYQSTVGSVDEANGEYIFYRLADDGHKICLPDQESKITALYEQTGEADYYLLDTTNKQFKLPRTQNRRLIQAVKNADGTWYNLYSDGYVEQGSAAANQTSANAQGVTNVYTLPIPMLTTGRSVSVQVNGAGNYGNVTTRHNDFGDTETTLSIGIAAPSSVTTYIQWQVSGYATESAYASAGMRLEYYYVGNYLRGIDEVNVGAWAELANGVDVAKLTEEVNEVKDAALAEIESAGEATANFQQPLVTLSATSGTVSLEINKIYSMKIDGDLTFVLPASVNTNFFNQIKVMAQITGTPVITWGTDYFVNKEAPTIEEGCYDFYFDWDNNLGGWVLGAVTKG